MRLTAENVYKTVKACLFRDDEIVNGSMPARAVVVDAITMKLGFDPDKITQQTENIRSMLGELPPEFKDGMSFLNACLTKTGEQWGEHRDMAALFALGQAAGMVTCCLPRDLWDALPGGVPYYQVNI